MLLSRQIMLILSEHFNDVCAKTSQLCKLPTWLTWPIITLHKSAVLHIVKTKSRICSEAKVIHPKYSKY